MASQSQIRVCLVFLAMAGLVLAGCARTRVRPVTIPPPPPDLPALPPPPTVRDVDAGIGVRKKEIDRLRTAPRPAPAPGISQLELDRELRERDARVKFLQAEIEALLQQRKASELYFHGEPASQPAPGSAAPSGDQALSPLADVAPPSVATVDERIKLRRSWLSWLTARRPTLPDGNKSEADLDLEIKQRETRIAFLKGEIKALILQRKASEIYYQQKSEIK